MMISLFFLQTTPSLISMWPLLAMVLVFYFFFIRPQAKKQKEQVKFLESLDKGEEVVTASGLIGRVNKIDGSIVTLTIAEKTFVRVTKGSISKEMTEAYRKSDSASAEGSAS
ncbi:MAG: preprotein translocase subunit YajC [Saprospiraceae bacterium]|nr:preprotein translocase subunit YajC [Candidatus Opimibacter skivensis]